jgi:tetratricopeptide (TPR) repeat protein
MSFFPLKTPLTATDRIERRRLIFADSLALLTLFAVTALLAVLTNYLYQSYASHQVTLANRWLARGQQAMKAGKPEAAIDALSSALAYDPGQRNTQIQLAEALASAGRTQEATVYFNALLENEQGSGLINLQLARLAGRQGDESQAIEDYQKAIYGNWEGDGYVRRRSVRLELIDYLIAHKRLDQARNELLVASGNAPEDDLSVQLDIAQTMEQAQDPSDALRLYKKILHRHVSLREGLQGAGRSAFQLGYFQQAKKYLARALEGPSVEQEPASVLAETRDMLNETTRVLQMYPSSHLSLAEQATRILAARKLASARLAQCTQASDDAEAKDAALKNAVPAPPASKSSSLANPLAGLASRLTGRETAPAPGQAAAAPEIDPLDALRQRWQQLPASVSLSSLARNPDLAQTQMQLVYDTELVTQQVCGTPTGDDSLLLKIAQAPNRVEEE